MWKLIARLKTNGFAVRRALYFMCVTGIAVAAFFWGVRQGASQTRPNKNSVALPEYTQATAADYARRVVATIFGNIPITREELGEYLIARYGTDKLGGLVNHRIIEKACNDLGIYVTDNEVQVQLNQDLRALSKGGFYSLKDFETKILRPYNKTLYEWKEDVLRPQLYMTKLARPEVKVDNTDIQNLFEARYGPMVKCRMIVLPEMPHQQKNQIWEEVRFSESKFHEYASKQFMEPFRAKAGEAPPVHKNFGDPSIEREAFRLKVGEVSGLIELQDKTTVILKCDGHIPAQTNVSFEKERENLHQDVYRLKLNQKIPEIMKRLRDKAVPIVHLRDQISSEELNRAVEKELNPRGQQVPGPMPPSQVLPASGVQPSDLPGPPPGAAAPKTSLAVPPPETPVSPPGTVPLPPAPPANALLPTPANDQFAPVPLSGGLDHPTSPITGLPKVAPTTPASPIIP